MCKFSSLQLEKEAENENPNKIAVSENMASKEELKENRELEGYLTENFKYNRFYTKREQSSIVLQVGGEGQDDNLIFNKGNTEYFRKKLAVALIKH